MKTSVAARARPRAATPALSLHGARLTAFGALCAFGLLHWMLMVELAGPGRALAGLAVALAAGGALLAARGRPPLIAAVVVAALGLALIAAGVDGRQLRPDRWNEVAAAVGAGVDAVAGARIPYQGVDPDLRLVIPLGGTVLALVAALLAFWPRAGGRTGHRGAALVALVGLYAVPAVALIMEAEFLRGALLAVLVIVFLRLERLGPRELTTAGALAAGAATIALAAAPALDTGRPWLDYEELAQRSAGSRSVTFAWDHDYAGIGWPRDGRELLRISSRQRTYWKADHLDLFDGFRWARNPVQAGVPPPAQEHIGVPAARLKAWSFPIRVTVRSLRSETLPTAGVADAVTMPGREPSLIRPGVWTAGREVHRGDAYRAEVYVPQPSRRELATAGTAYGPEKLEDTAVYAYASHGANVREQFEVYTAAFAGQPQLIGFGPGRSASSALLGSNLRRVFALSRRLLRGAATPHEYVRTVQRRLRVGYRYDETPPRAARTLDGFLFDAKAGFCQQYSGAMALLLRMGGVPARVATGFAPGAYDAVAEQYVVRDLDAHSWVEAWFPGVGWVVFDPTPAAAPPRSQALTNDASAGGGNVRDLGTTLGAAAAAEPRRDTSRGSLALAALALVPLVALGILARMLWGRRSVPRPAAVSELERALRSAGETVPPGTTLTALEARFGASTRAGGYLRALRAERYCAGVGGGPTAEQRRGLRRELTRGRGPLARGRTWLALRPRLRP